MEEIFTKRLKKTDVGVRLSFPMKGFNDPYLKFPKGKDKVEFWARDYRSGKWWKFGLSRRSKCNCKAGKKSHPKPVLSSGWLAYVKAKDLKIGDGIILYRDNDRMSIRIRARRKSPNPLKLFGHEIEYWHDI